VNSSTEEYSRKQLARMRTFVAPWLADKARLDGLPITSEYMTKNPTSQHNTTDRSSRRRYAASTPAMTPYPQKTKISYRCPLKNGYNYPTNHSNYGSTRTPNWSPIACNSTNYRLPTATRISDHSSATSSATDFVGNLAIAM